MDPATLFEENLTLIERVVASVCRRARVYDADAEDFSSAAKLALMENDYAVLRRFEARSSFATFVTVIVHRLLMDELTRRLGKWHPSREAERLGPAAIELEKIVRRDRRSIEEAMPFVHAIDPTLTRDKAASIEARLPERNLHPQAVALDPDAAVVAAAAGQADERVIAADVQRLSDRAGRVIRATLDSMPLEDRMIIRFHFGESINIADVAELLRLPKRPLYRRVESLVGRLRSALTDAGIDAGDARELIGSATAVIDFGLRNGNSEPARRTISSEAAE
jgi:RNA polymerase sigma factor (sigma-70 family)